MKTGPIPATPAADRAGPKGRRRGSRRTAPGVSGPRRGVPPVAYAGAAIGLAIVGALYFGVIGVGPSARDAARPPAAEGPSDPRITLWTGQSAPGFTLPNVEGGTVRLSDLTARSNVLLYFQEGSMCPPCWQQMRDLRRDGEKLASLNVQLVTITVDPIEQLRTTVSREQIEGMTLLADTDLSVSRTYQMLYTGMMGGTRPGHSFVLVGRDGLILWRKDFREMYVPDTQILEPVAQALATR